MKTGFILRDPDSAPPAFYAPGATPSPVTPSQNWSEDPAKALCFASEGDAQTFAAVFLPQLAPYVKTIPYTEP